MNPINDPYCRNYIEDLQTTKPYFKQQIYFMTCSLKWSLIQTINPMSFGIQNSKLIDVGGKYDNYSFYTIYARTSPKIKNAF